jgi:hypothetical protein
MQEVCSDRACRFAASEARRPAGVLLRLESAPSLIHRDPTELRQSRPVSRRDSCSIRPRTRYQIAVTRPGIEERQRSRQASGEV